MKRLTSLVTVTLICATLFAQQTNFTSPNNNTASILRLNSAGAEMSKIAQPVAVASYRSAKQKAGIALLVLGPVNMMVGLGLLGWSIGYARGRGDVPADSRKLGIAAGLGGFHLLSGAALTAGGAVLLHKGRKESTGNIYFKLPEMSVHANRGAGTGMSMRTGLVF